MKNFLDLLLHDQTTGENILWANDEHGKQKIKPAQVDLIRPRHEKNRDMQKLRTKTRAEIFTPPEVCKFQNDLVCDERDWQKFIDAKFLEITCGEAPYLVSRYNAVTGEPIEIQNRVGLLDRKFHVINKETSTINDWQNFAVRAVQSVYGYEFQGDNLFLARRNVFDTVVEYFMAKGFRKPSENFWSEIAEIISWNLWQMDGIKNTIPYAQKPCQIMDWRTGKPFMFFHLFGW